MCVVVARCSIRKKEIVLPVLVALQHIGHVAFVPATLRVVLEAIQNVSGMEVVDPMQVVLFAVIP